MAIRVTEFAPPRVPDLKYTSAMANIDFSGEASSSEIQAVARVGQICALFGPETTELTASDVADRLGLNRTTAYRYCTSLVTAGILERGPKRATFVLGGLMLQLGIHALGRQRVVEVAPAHLRKLSAAVRATAVLSLWGARGPVVALVQEDTSRTVVVTVHPGTQLDPLAAQTAMYLAFHSDHHAIEKIAKELSPADRAELEASVYSARRAGFHSVTEPRGLYIAAAPVFDEHGITATVAVLGTDPAVDLRVDSPVITELLRTASALTDAVGGGASGSTEGQPRANL